MPIFSCSTLASGARQLVVHDAFEMTVSLALILSSLTPMTNVPSTSLSPGAEMMTFFAPAATCAPALAFEVKRPVHSSTTSTPRSFHGSLDGSRSAQTLILSPLTTRSPPSTPTSPGNRPCAVSYCVRCAFVSASPRSLTATIWISLRALGFVQRAQHVATDAAVAVDGDLHSHGQILRDKDGQGRAFYRPRISRARAIGMGPLFRPE